MKRLRRDEKGQALILALILLLIGGLIAAPLLAYMGTGLLTGEVYERRTAELYAADAGVEDAIWRIQTGSVNLTGCRPTYGPYRIADVNARNVTVTITLASNTSGRLYNITSVAATPSDNSSTTVEAYLKYTPGGELNIFSGALASKTSIALKKDSTINGDVYYCNGTPLDRNQIRGNWTDKGCGEFPDQSQNVAFANTMKALAMQGTTYRNGLNIQSNQTLGPAYIIGNLYISDDVTVTITGVVYVTGTITAKKEWTLAGCGVVVAEGDIYISKIAGFGNNCDSMLMSLNGDITFKKEGTVNALVYAPNGAVSFDKGGTVHGGIVAQSINADKEGHFTYVKRTSWDLPGELPSSYKLINYTINP